MCLPLKIKLVPIYNGCYDLDEDEFNKEGQRIITYEEVLVGYNLTTLQSLLGTPIQLLQLMT